MVAAVWSSGSAISALGARRPWDAQSHDMKETSN